MSPYQVPTLLADVDLLDLLELTGSTVRAAPLLKLSQPSVSRRRRRLQQELGLTASSSLRQGDGACLRLLRRAAKRHRFEAGVWRVGGDGWGIDPLMATETTLVAPPRFAPLAQWQALVAGHVLDGALVSGHELRLAGLDLTGEPPRPLLWQSCMVIPLVRLPLLLVCRPDAPRQPDAAPPAWSTVLMPSLSCCAGLATLLRQRQLRPVHLAFEQWQPRVWLAALEQNEATAALATPLWLRQLQELSPQPLQAFVLAEELMLDIWLLVHRRDWWKQPDLEARARALGHLVIQ